jgi:hypothetical protein
MAFDALPARPQSPPALLLAAAIERSQMQPSASSLVPAGSKLERVLRDLRLGEQRERRVIEQGHPDLLAAATHKFSLLRSLANRLEA